MLVGPRPPNLPPGANETALHRCLTLRREHYPTAEVSTGPLLANGDVHCSLNTYSVICRNPMGIGYEYPASVIALVSPNGTYKITGHQSPPHCKNGQRVAPDASP